MISQTLQTESITLTSVNNVGSIHHYQLQPDQGVFLGRSSNCGWQFGGAGLSDIHCRIEVDNGKVWVQDWMSAEGTRVNGQPITARVEIQDTDSIEIGEYRISLGTKASPSGPPVTSGGDSIGDCRESRSETADPHHEQDQDVAPPQSSRDTSQEIPSAVQLPSSVADDCPSGEPESIDFGEGCFEFEEEETYDRETVALLHAEIEDLQAQLAQRDAERFDQDTDPAARDQHNVGQDADSVLQRMQQLIDEADQSDERVALLEEMLFVAEEANRSEREERGQLEAWVGDIEKRIGQREDEHKAEADALRKRLEELSLQRDQLQKQLRQAAAAGATAAQNYEQTLEELQNRNAHLQEKLAESETQCHSLQQRIEQQTDQQELALREERVNLAKEQANVARLRHELSKQLSDIEELPKPENQVDQETAHKIRTLREHLREIHEQEKQKEREAPIAARLAKLWKRVEY